MLGTYAACFEPEGKLCLGKLGHCNKPKIQSLHCLHSKLFGARLQSMKLYPALLQEQLKAVTTERDLGDQPSRKKG